MNILPNGRIAVGAPGSIARVKEEYPDVLYVLQRLKAHGIARPFAEDELLKLNRFAPLEVDSLLSAAGY